MATTVSGFFPSFQRYSTDTADVQGFAFFLKHRVLMILLDQYVKRASFFSWLYDIPLHGDATYISTGAVFKRPFCYLL